LLIFITILKLKTNFILTDRIWGIDFEESRLGKTIEDIAGMCASILTTDPMFSSEKFLLCEIFIDSYSKLAPGRIENINDEIAYVLLEKIQWRPDEEEILRKYCKIIREKGLI
jgi:thiamine kinase-like enzyme